MKEVLVIGGGPAGLAAAEALVDSGVEVVLVERNESLGGMARELTCKGLIECRNCGVCFATDRANAILRKDDAEVFLLSEVTFIQRADDGFTAKIRISPRYVTDNCIGCGKCVEACPVEGKAIFPPTGSGQPRIHWIDRAKCLHFKKAKCVKCASSCPANAVDYEDRARNVTRNVSGVVYATGMSAVDAHEMSRLGCGVLRDVISSVDVERMLNENGRLLRPSDGMVPKRVAVVQCVGSRSMKTGVEYCSKFCCKYATKIAQMLFDVDPELNLDFYFMDLRTLYEPQDDFKEWAKQHKKQVRMIRSMPATVTAGMDGKVVVRSSGDTDLEIKDEEYDLVILSVGMRPEGATTDLAKSLGISTDIAGFAAATPELERAGVFVCGAVSRPQDIEETVVRTIASTSRMCRTREVAR